MSTKRKPNSRRPSPLPAGAAQIKHPSRALAPLLAILDEVCAEVLESLSEAGPSPVGYLSFDRAILNRGLNLLEATRVLSEPLHWEVAASCARQMFELVLNMESLAAMPDREQASTQYALFGLLQQVNARIVEDEYGRATGREVDEQRAARALAARDSGLFDQFKKPKPRRDGSTQWSESWNGKNAWTMADESSNPIRKAQYRQLFVAWSGETHASPGALLDSMLRVLGPGWQDSVLNNDLRETSQIVGMILFLFFELWMSLVNVPPLEQARWNDWIARISTYIAANWNVPELATTN